MKKTLVILSMAAAVPAVMSAQSAVDAYNLSQTEIRGTARFMSMGGAFTALGGDLSTLNQNPAGIGIYRRSEIGATLDISPQSVSAQSPTDRLKTSSTPVSCNNFGYVGTASLSGAMQTFSWGATYNRVTSFNRKFSAFDRNPGTSLSNYIADYTTASGVQPGSMEFTNSYNPYRDSDIDWLSILAYSSYMINPTVNGGYRGLWQQGTTGNAYTEVRESGYIDEYSIDFGGNVENTVMWGIGFGITDLKYNNVSYYSEMLDGAYVPDAKGQMITSNADVDLSNWRSINGTGFNLKVGLIFKPINEVRIGVAFHTPTWYTLSNNSYAEAGYEYDFASNSPVNKKYEYTDNAYYNFRLTTPWKVMVGAAFVLGSSAIVSADYEFQAYDKTRLSYQAQFGEYISDDYVNADIQEYYKSANIFRVGAEYRLTSSFSLRAGYNYTSSTSRNYSLDGGEVLTAGTDPSFTMDRGINAISVGLGYRYKAFYVDAAYVYRNKKSIFKPYTDYGQVRTPSFDLTENTNSIILSAGFKF